MCDGESTPPGVSPGYRRIDHVIGIVAELEINGEVVKTVASSPFVLEKHKEGSIK
ncbi:hypothetical protein NT6N_02010 [Oceaniferula spumae]|uniref:Uncharacterized protein n=1 Tax=Oceaniferula spumae TaxID=2979115 RepID=A0AAT9FGQ7_9BACT